MQRIRPVGARPALLLPAVALVLALCPFPATSQLEPRRDSQVDSGRAAVVTGGSAGSPGTGPRAPSALTGGTTPTAPLAQEATAGCEPGWLPAFGEHPGFPGTTGTAHAFAVFDDGSGPALYMGGFFGSAGTVEVNHIARWSGSSWSALGDGMDDSVLALAVFDDGSGPALYAGGTFKTAGGLSANRVARWDGASWSALGSGMNNTVETLAVFDDGGGPALYAGGVFVTAGGVPANRIARWDGASWSPLGSGMDARVKALAVFNDGGGPALYAGGLFTTADGMAANHIARWNGTGWTAPGSGANASVAALAVHDDGAGEALYAGGEFTAAGGVPARRVARWDGANWSVLGSGTDDDVEALAVFDDGTGPALYAGGDFTAAGGAPANRIARWDGAGWSPLGDGVTSQLQFVPFVSALAAFDDGSGPKLYVAGEFTMAGSVVAERIAGWNGGEWSPLGHGPNGSIDALAVYDDGSGPALHAGGAFTAIGGKPLDAVAKWDGTGWSALGGGVGLGSLPVRCLQVYDDGGGSALYAGGSFTVIGGGPASHIARWDGSNWSALGDGVGPLASHYVTALAVFDDGEGAALYVGGVFSSAGGVAANGIARWNGAEWSSPGGSLDGFAHALAVYEDTGGPALYVGGAFTSAGGVSANRIARWDGLRWSPLGIGVNDVVRALAVFDDGGGPALYVGGYFTTAGGLPASRIAKWNGTSWSALGTGVSMGYITQVRALFVHDDGSGSALYVGGSFELAGGVQAPGIARWNGSGWSAMGSGLSGAVHSGATFDHGGHTALFLGGGFSAIETQDSHLAIWGCPDEPSAWTDLGSGLGGSVGLPCLAGTGTLLAGSPGALTLTNANPSSPAMLFVSLSSTPAPFKGGTLVPVPVAQALALLVDGSGTVSLAWTAWPAGLPSGTTLYLQDAIQDGAAVQGVSLSNALLATTP